MTLQIALLRAVNVGGTKKLPMADLRAFVESLGFSDVRSLLQSGNLTFRSTAGGEKLERLLEREAERMLGLRTEFFTRTATEWEAVLARNPFPKEARDDPGRLIVVALKREPVKGALDSLRAAIKGREIADLHGKHAYIMFPDGMGNSRLTLPLIQRHLGTIATCRNWNTATKLGELARASRAGEKP